MKNITKNSVSVIKILEALAVKQDVTEDISFKGTVVKWDRVSVQI